MCCATLLRLTGPRERVGQSRSDIRPLAEASPWYMRKLTKSPSIRLPHSKLNASHMAKTIDPKRVAELYEAAQRVDRDEQGEIKARGRAVFAQHERLRAIAERLKAERQRQGLSLEQLSSRSGLDVAELERLEKASDINVSLFSLMRYAEVLGQTLRISVA